MKKVLLFAGNKIAKLCKWIFTVEGLTFLMVAATVWMAAEARLSRIDLYDPNISIVDVNLQYIDSTGTVAREQTWSGEIKGNSGAISDVKKIIIAVKFANHGTRDGYVKLVNVKGLLKETGSDNRGVGDNTEVKHLVPSLGETGWLYAFDITDDMTQLDKNKGLGDEKRPYIAPSHLYVYEIFDSRHNFIERKEARIGCITAREILDPKCLIFAPE